MAARGAAEDLALGAKIRKRQDLALAMSTAQKSLIGLFASANPQETSISHEISIEQKKLDELKNASAVLDLELHTTSARFMLLADPSALSVANVQSYLKDDEALVDFFVTSSHRNLPGETYIWVITKSKVHLFASPIDDNALLKFVRTLRCGLDRTLWEQLDSACANLTETSLDERAPLPFRMDLAYALYWQLFGAIQADIAERKLLIITPRSLATVPLEVLPTDWPDFNTKRFADDYTGVKWLIKEHEISVLPSVNSLRLLRSLRHSRPATLPFVGFGAPTLQGNSSCKKNQEDALCPSEFTPFADLQPGRAEKRSGSLKSVLKDGPGQIAVTANVQRLCPLPETAVELNCISRTLCGEVFTAGEFTKAKINILSKSGQLADYRIVHFATHGLLPSDDGEISGEPSLVTTPPQSMMAFYVHRISFNLN